MGIFEESSSYFPTELQQFQFFDKYSRFKDDAGRRETWVETVDRAVSYLKELSENKLPEDDYKSIREGMLDMGVAPSMRLLAMAGDAARRSNITIYNCSFLPVDSLEAWVEALIISMSGCGVGFSVEKEHVNKLPVVKDILKSYQPTHYVIPDTTEGWAKSLELGLKAWFAGEDITFDYSEIRPAGAVLKVKGGRACLTGDTILYKDKKKSQTSNTITIKELYEKRLKSLRKVQTMKIRALDEETGVIYRNNIIDVIDNGIQKVYRVTTKNGYSIKSTLNHRFMSIDGRYNFLCNFNIGDKIAVNGEQKTNICLDCNKFISRRAKRCRKCTDLRQTKPNALDTTARQRKEIRLFREGKNKCEWCHSLSCRFEVHHIDKNPHNNTWENLLYLCVDCHQKHHVIENTYGNPYAHKYISFDEIISIDFVGAERVYDLQMQSPNHNFIANGFISHNSGPKPLQELLDFARTTIRGASGRKLSSLECHDLMCEVANAAVSGGVRRSAMISLFDFDDEEMRDCKNGFNFPIRRWNANNSAVWPENKLTKEEIAKEMNIMFDGKRGEPGIFIRRNANLLKPARRKYNQYFGTNPCFHENTLIQTVNGLKKIKDIKSPDYVYSMDKYGKLCIKRCSASWRTKKKAQTLKITIANGRSLQVTPDHKIMVEGRGWIQASKLRLKDKVVALVRNRRGSQYAGVKLTTQGKRDFIMEHRFIYEGVHGVLDKSMDVHHKNNDSYDNRLENLEVLKHTEHATLTRYSCSNDHQVKDSFGRFISSEKSLKGKKKIKDMPEHLKTNLHQYATVEKIEVGDIVDVYDISVEDTHCLVAEGIIAHNCGEIILRPYQFCNLSIAVAREDDTKESLKEKVRLATIIGTIQSMGTNFPGLRKIWQSNCEEERLLGVDITGKMDSKVAQDSFVLQELRHYAVEVNKKYAQLLGINQSVSVTCHKPSGNSGTLFGCANGLHPRFSKYYLRRATVGKTSPFYKIFKEAGVELYPNRGQDGEVYSYVVSFPCKSPDNAIVQKDTTALKQLDNWLQSKVYWTEHNPSCTITYNEDERDEIIDWLFMHQDLIGGLSFAPNLDFGFDPKVHPYFEITKEEYEEAIKNFPKVDWSLLEKIEKEDNTKASREIACSSGQCDII